MPWSQGGGAAEHCFNQRCCGVLRGLRHWAEWDTCAVEFGAGGGELQLGQSRQGWNRLRHPGAGRQQQRCWDGGPAMGRSHRGFALLNGLCWLQGPSWELGM